MYLIIREMFPLTNIWLKMFRELGEEGLLANDIFVDTRIQMEEKLAKGRYFCMLYQYSDTISQQKALYENDPDSIYMAVEGPRNSNGDDPTLPTNNMNGWTLTLISKNCKYPERAIAFMDYMMSEHGQMLIYLGVEGVTYDIVDGKPVLKEDVSKILNTAQMMLIGCCRIMSCNFSGSRRQVLLLNSYSCGHANIQSTMDSMM